MYRFIGYKSTINFSVIFPYLLKNYDYYYTFNGYFCHEYPCAWFELYVSKF